jgi:hypothetical protein
MDSIPFSLRSKWVGIWRRMCIHRTIYWGVRLFRNLNRVIKFIPHIYRKESIIASLYDVTYWKRKRKIKWISKTDRKWNDTLQRLTNWGATMPSSKKYPFHSWHNCLRYAQFDSSLKWLNDKGNNEN